MKDPIQANARGAAIIAGVALGETTFIEAAERVEVAREYMPNPKNRAIYDNLFAAFLEIYKRNRKLYARLNKRH
jgi:xylulokinase